MPALPHPPPLSVYTPSPKITCPPQNILLHLNQKRYERIINHGLGFIGNVDNPKHN